MGCVNLHDWVDELCDELDIELELDEALVLDLARDAAPRLGQRVSAAGFPYFSIVGTALNLTGGNVSALTGVDELMVTGMMFDKAARIRSLELTLDACRAMVDA